MEKTWHAVYVNSRAEKKVSELLTVKGIHAYVPLQKTMKQWSDRKKMVELPLLNGYVFVKTDVTENDKVLQTRGVVSFVKVNGAIGIVREVEIERLKQLIELGYQLEVSQSNKAYSEGDKVKITSGPLRNIEGIVIESKEGRFIEIMLESIGQPIKVKLPKELLLAI